jgi:hypothetical protein
MDPFTSVIGLTFAESKVIGLALVLGMFGGLAHYLLKRGDLITYREETQSLGYQTYIPLIIARFIVSFIVTLVFALYTIGSVKPDPYDYAKFEGAAIVVGYFAPQLASSNEERLLLALNKVLEKKVP